MTPKNAHAVGRLFIVAVSALCLILGSGSSGFAAATASPCSKMGTIARIHGVNTPVCTQLHTSGAAIRLPKDSSTAIYGVLNTLSSVTLTSRANKQTEVKKSLVPTTPNIGIGGLKSFSQIIYKAALRSGKITGLTPVLFVPTTTPLKAYAGKIFVGDVVNMVPAEGVPQSDYVRLDFSKNFTAEGALKGTFTNLKQSVRRYQLVEPPAPCEAALLGLDAARNNWYSAIWGTETAIRLVWDPAMHAPQDSELVVYIGSIGYMTHSPSLVELMTGTINVESSKQFMIHGNPIGTPSSLTGVFQATFPVRTCQYINQVN